MPQKNPNWASDELILALDLYLRRGQLAKGHADVSELSELLNALPIHTTRPDLERFRNPAGVALKLATFGALDPSHEGAGMSHGGRGDVGTSDRFHSRPDEVHRMAKAIAARRFHPADVALPEPDEDDVPEGRLLFRWHRTRERNRGVVDRKKQSVLDAGGRLECEACGFNFGRQYGSAGESYIECHHRVPLSETGETRTKTSDLILLCANCHRVAHRARPWLTPDALQGLVRAAPHE